MLLLQHIYVIIVVVKNQVPEDFKMKRFLSLMIIASLTLSYTIPVSAIENTLPANSAQNKVVKNKKEKNKSTRVYPVKNKYEYINLDWWSNFNDDLLNSYIARAVENNQDLKMAALTIDEFYQKVAMQRASELPSIIGGLNGGYGKIIGSEHESFGIPLIASYELDLFGKNHNKTTSVRKLYEASILDERAAYIAIASAVGSTYVNIVKLDALVDLQTEIVALRKDIYEMMDIAHKEGLASATDLVRANKNYVLGVTDLTEIKKQRTKLLNALAVLIGDSPNNIEEYQRINWRELSYQGEIPEYVGSEIITQRPDYLKAEKMIEKAGVDVRAARKECIPSITLGGGVLFNAKEFGSLLSTSNMLWGLGGGLMHNIFAGGRIMANLKSKKIAYEKSLKNYEKTNLTAMQEVNDTLVAVNMDREKLLKQKEIRTLEEEDFRLSELKYNEGVISKLDLDQMKENLLNVNRMVYSSQFDCMIDYINYYKAVGAKV